jgi:hypothetical protein
MVIDAVTATGAIYRIDRENSFWVKMRNGYPESQTNRIWALKISTDKLESLVWPWAFPDGWEDAPLPVVGRHLFISGKDEWYASTKIVEIIEDVDWPGSHGFLNV